MSNVEKTAAEVVSYEELKEKHSKKSAIDQAKAKIQEDYSNNGKVFQIPGVGIVRAIMKQDKSTGEPQWSFPQLTNFTISDLSLIQNLDSGENSVKFNAKNIRGIECCIEDNVKIFNETKDFREALNSMHLSFKGNVNDLQDVKECIVSEVLTGEKFVYKTAGFREINGELVYITHDGALKKHGLFDEELRVEPETFKSTIKDLDLITAEEVKSIKNALNNFNAPDIVYPVLGSSTACNFASFFNESKDGKLHILFLSGGSDSGKNKTLDHIIKPLLNIDYKSESCTSATQANFNRSTDESCTLPLIYDEHTVRNLRKDRKDMIYTWIRTTTEHTVTHRVDRTSPNKRISYKTQAPMMMLGENIPADVSILNRCNLVFLSEKKRKSKSEYEKNYLYLVDNELLLRKMGYTVKRYILEHYGKERFDSELKQLTKALSNFKLGSREFKTFKDCVFGIHVLNNAIKYYTDEVIFQDLNNVVECIYNNIVENVAGGGTSAEADYIEVLEKMDMMIQENYLKEGWHYIFDLENDIVKIDIKRSYIEFLAYCKDKNISNDIMSEKEFVKKLTNSNFIAGSSSDDYYKPQRLIVSHGKKALRRVYLLKMSTCKEFDFVGLANQIEIEPLHQ